MINLLIFLFGLVVTVIVGSGAVSLVLWNSRAEAQAEGGQRPPALAGAARVDQ